MLLVLRTLGNALIDVEAEPCEGTAQHGMAHAIRVAAVRAHGDPQPIWKGQKGQAVWVAAPHIMRAVVDPVHHRTAGLEERRHPVERPDRIDDMLQHVEAYDDVGWLFPARLDLLDCAAQ